MEITLVGLSHHTAPVEVRERLHFPDKDLPGALQQLRELPGVLEAVIVSTCNRVEVLLRQEGAAEPVALVREFLGRVRHVAPHSFASYLYCHRQRHAIRHLFRVAASLDSMIVGEPQVLGQLKTAYATARAVGTVGSVLDAVLTRAFAVAKRVRTETNLGASAVSVSYAAVELARKIFGSLNGKRVFVIGAGKMSELAARHLLRNGAESIFVANRTLPRAEELAARWGGQAIQFDQLLNYASLADIIISSTGAPHYIIKKEHGERFLAQRKNRPMFFIDIAVPRDIDPTLNDLENIFVYDIDDLQQVVEANRRQRQREAKQAEEIVESEVDMLLGRLKALELTPTLVGLQEKLHGWRQQELERSALKSLTPEQRQAVEEMSRSLVNKILHGPLTHLKRLPQEPDGLKMVEFVRKIFQLKE